MKSPKYPSTPKQARKWFQTHGISIREWCSAKGLNPLAVTDLLRGKSKGTRGESHRAAVQLGLKPDPKELERKAA